MLCTHSEEIKVSAGSPANAIICCVSVVGAVIVGQWAKCSVCGFREGWIRMDGG